MRMWPVTFILVFIAVSLLSLGVSATSRCRHRRMAFIKTHKTASTTVVNILLRFALKHNLMVAIPNEHRYSFGDFEYMADLPKPKGSLYYDISCEHGRYSQEAVNALVGPDAALFTILRDPIAQFSSMWRFFDMTKRLRVSLEEWIMGVNSHQEVFFPPSVNFSFVKFMAGHYQYGMTYDLGIGMDGNRSKDDVDFRSKIRQLDERMDLVMITEMFDESLVLLKKLVMNCARYSDLAYLVVNPSRGKKPALSSTASLRLKRLLDEEYMVYHHFKARLKLQLQQLGRRALGEELLRLRMARKSKLDSCRQLPSEPTCPRLQMFNFYEAKALKRKEKRLTHDSSFTSSCPCLPYDRVSSCMTMRHGGIVLSKVVLCKQQHFVKSLKR